MNGFFREFFRGAAVASAAVVGFALLAGDVWIVVVLWRHL